MPVVSELSAQLRIGVPRLGRSLAVKQVPFPFTLGDNSRPSKAQPPNISGFAKVKHPGIGFRAYRATVANAKTASYA